MKDILVIDDQYFVTVSLKRLLNYYGYSVRSANNGYQGIKMAREQKPDLIIIDLNMPIMDGKTAINKIKQDADLKNIPIIVLTAFNNVDNVILLNKIGVADYIVKPFEQEQLIKRIKKALGEEIEITTKKDERKKEVREKTGAIIRKISGAPKIGSAVAGKVLSINELRAGMILGENVMLNNMVLYTKDTVLTENIIEKLKSLGYSELKIKTAEINKVE